VRTAPRVGALRGGRTGRAGVDKAGANALRTLLVRRSDPSVEIPGTPPPPVRAASLGGETLR
jgi:hypothetical protein